MLRILSRSVVLASMTWALGACTTSTDRGSPPSTSGDQTVKLPSNTIPVPIVGQQQDFTGGDVATLALLRFWKHDDYANVPETALYAPLKTTQADGTEPYDIATYLNGIAGMSAEYRTATQGDQLSDLEAAVDRGEPPIIDVQAWRTGTDPYATDWHDGQYAVMVGYDAANLFFMDPTTPGGHYGYISRAEITARWHDVVGTNGIPTDRMAIFVHGDAPGYWGTPIPPRASPIL